MSRTEHPHDRALVRARNVDGHGKAVDGNHGGRHSDTLAPTPVFRGEFSPSQSAPQAAAARSACFAAMSRNVCGSEALTVIAGFGVGNAMPKTAIWPRFSNEK